MTHHKLIGQFVDLQKRSIYPAEIHWEREKIIEIRKIPRAPKRYILPGFIDAHVHIESSMLTPGRFAQAAVRHGTLAVVSDPHEIANVLGKNGIDYMLADARKVLFHFFFGAPSCVPATSFENSGARLNAKEVADLLQQDNIYFLSEMMNFPGVLGEDQEVMEKLKSAQKVGKPIDGHAPGLGGADLEKYISSGISTDHETESVEEAREKIKAGMYIQIREGSAARNFEALHSLIPAYPSKLMFCSDDLHPEMLQKGHINEMVIKAVAKGYDVFDVLRIACLNPAQHYGFDLGSLRENAIASFIVVEDLKRFRLIESYCRGVLVFQEGESRIDYTPAVPLNHFCSRKPAAEEWTIQNKKRPYRVIEATDGSLWTGSGRAEAQEGDFLKPMVEKDLLMLAVKERYTDQKLQKAFVRGFGLKQGALASTVAHDSHNILAVGADLTSLEAAVNRLIDMQGGLVVTKGTELHCLNLPLAGLMSTASVDEVASQYLKLNTEAKKLGCKLKAPFMTLAFMSLLVIPELKLGDQGLFDVKNFRLCDLFLD